MTGAKPYLASNVISGVSFLCQQLSGEAIPGFNESRQNMLIPNIWVPQLVGFFFCQNTRLAPSPHHAFRSGNIAGICTVRKIDVASAVFAVVASCVFALLSLLQAREYRNSRQAKVRCLLI